MSDVNSGLPIRSQLPGQANYDDIIVKLADASNAGQLLAVDAAGLIGNKLYDGAGTAITSQANGGQQALDVGINVAGTQIDPRSIRALTAADVVTANQGTANTNTNAWFTRLTDGTNNSILLATGELTVAVTQLLTEDHDFGASGASTLRVAALLGNATGSADFNYGAIGAQSLRTAAQLGNATGAIAYSYGAVDAQTIRTASQIGNATGAADFGNGATGAQTLRVAANLAIGGADVSATNPVPVVISVDNPGTEVNNYNTASAVAAGATSNHDYTVTAGKTLLLTQIEASASGKMKIEVQIETGVATGVFNTRFVQFSSTAETNMSISLRAPIAVAAGVRVRVIRTNKDNQAQDVYSTICGQETP